MTFNTYSTFDPLKSLISQRLYVSEFDADTLKKTVHSTKFGYPTERRGLGLTQYFSFVGPILKILGIALSTKNERGETIYVNKSSFSHLILRVKESSDEMVLTHSKVQLVSATVDSINILKVNKLYYDNYFNRADIQEQNRKLETHWDSSKNIQQLINNFLNI